MELGGRVCTPRTPPCETCPVGVLCRANRENRQHDVPRPKTPRRMESVREAIVVVRRGRRLLLMRRPDGGRWAKLWDFPRFPFQGGSPDDVQKEIAENVLAAAGVRIAPGRRIHTLAHGVTRFRITLECYEAKFLSDDPVAASATELRWLRPAELEEYPLSSTGRKLARMLADRNVDAPA